MIEPRYRITGNLTSFRIYTILLFVPLLAACRAEEAAPPPPLPAETSASLSIQMTRPPTDQVETDAPTTGPATLSDTRATSDPFWGMVTEAVAD